MKPNPIHRLPPPLEAAVQRLRQAARETAERSVESLGLAALGAHGARQRDALLEAQFELNRKSAKFLLTFNDALDERLLRELGQPTAVPDGFGPAARDTRWDALSLVDDHEVDRQIRAERCGMEIGHACEWELRELETYVLAVLGEPQDERPRNPLRPEVVAHALLAAVDVVSEQPDTRQLLASECARSLGALLRGTYAGVIAEFRRHGVEPAGLAVRQRPAASGSRDSTSDPETLGQAAEARASRPGRHSAHGAMAARSGYGSGFGAVRAPAGGRVLGQVDPAVMNLLRRLAQTDPGPVSSGWGGAEGLPSPETSLVGVPLSNVIRAHRDELRQASRGGVDHMVIDVIGFLFDQILADPKIPPPLAHQIARLQLPVLRAALGDPNFFSSRRHPVRRFVNRIASLAAAVDEPGAEESRALVTKVRELVTEVVEGDFDRIDVYEQKLSALEAFMAELLQRSGPADGAAALLAEKEDELQLRALYAQQLAGDLQDVAVPAFLREFLSQVWSRVLLKADSRGGDLGARLRRTARELVLSVHPKPSPVHRKQFLADLPKLMQELSEGLNLVGWPEAERRVFFGQLMPAHAESLKSQAVRALDLNLMAKQVEGALDKPLPSRETLRQSGTLPVLDQAIDEPALTREEAQRVGLLEESAVDWNGQVDIDLGEEPAAPAQPAAPAPGLPALADAPDPTRGRALADTLQIGFAYRMHLDDGWQKVRLTHISPGRTFFMFTHGTRQRRAVSLTHRMLLRMCETGRLCAYEQATLLERATERARRQLAALGHGLQDGLGTVMARPGPAAAGLPTR